MSSVIVCDTNSSPGRPSRHRQCLPALALAEQPPILSWSLRSPPEASDDFDMRRMAKLIDRLDPCNFIFAGTQDRGVARKGLGIAGYGDDKRHRGCAERDGLLFGSCPRRIEDDRVISVELQRAERAPKKVARRDRDLPQTCRPSRLCQSLKRSPLRDRTRQLLRNSPAGVRRSRCRKRDRRRISRLRHAR